MSDERFRATLTGWKVSSLGYRVKTLPRSRVLYRDKWDRVEIDAEMLAHEPSGFVMFTESIPTNLHHSRAEIVERIRRSFDADGAILETVPDGDKRPST